MKMTYHKTDKSFYAKDIDSGKAYAFDPVTGLMKEYPSELECWKAIDNFNRRKQCDTFFH